MIHYKITGSLPAPWEDFYTKHSGAPNVTIITEANRQPDDEDTEQEPNWITLFLPGNFLTKEQAIASLASINKVGVGEISLEEENFAQST